MKDMEPFISLSTQSPLPKATHSSCIEVPSSEEDPIRLSKALSHAGICSRRKGDELIYQGRVKVNGIPILKPETRVHPFTDRITVDDSPLPSTEKKLYLLFHKPVGYLCAHESGKKTIYQLLPFPYRLFTAGRLDRDSSGLLIITNDGVFAHRVIHPSFNREKEYLVQCTQPINDEHLSMIAKGAFIEGKWRKPLKVEKLRSHRLRVLVSEGKKHEVRIFVSQAQLAISELIRVRIDRLCLGRLPVGAYRPLTRSEKLLFT